MSRDPTNEFNEQYWDNLLWRSPAKETPMPRFEYQIIHLPDSTTEAWVEQLNHWGLAGWEAFIVVERKDGRMVVYMKRLRFRIGAPEEDSST